MGHFFCRVSRSKCVRARTRDRSERNYIHFHFVSLRKIKWMKGNFSDMKNFINRIMRKMSQHICCIWTINKGKGGTRTYRKTPCIWGIIGALVPFGTPNSLVSGDEENWSNFTNCVLFLKYEKISSKVNLWYRIHLALKFRNTPLVPLKKQLSRSKIMFLGKSYPFRKLIIMPQSQSLTSLMIKCSMEKGTWGHG